MSVLRRAQLTFLFFVLLSLTAFAQWSAVDSGTTNNLNGVCLTDLGVSFAVGDAGTILKSSDAGMTWAAVPSGTTNTLYAVHFFNPDEGVAVGDSGLILRTTNGGALWTRVSSGVSDSLRSVSFSGANGICGGTSQTILYSTDSGASWKIGQTGFFGGGFFGAHMLSSTLGFVAGQNSIFQPLVGETTDGGVTWTFHNFYFNGNEGSCNDIFFFDENTGLVSGVLWNGEGAISRTINSATDWTTSIYNPAIEGVDFPTPEIGFAVGWSGTILNSQDSGVTWTAQPSGTSTNLIDVAFVGDALTGIAVGEGGTILRTTNGGSGSALQLISATSRIGRFKIDLPLAGTPGVECRSEGAKRHYTMVFEFNNALTSVDQVSTSCGTVTATVVDASDAHRLVVSLSAVGCNKQKITVTVTGAHDDQGNTLSAAGATMGLLFGDTNGDSLVDQADVDRVKSKQGEATTSVNFREDVTADGQIDGTDLKLVQSRVGTMLPP
jgi:photosystem II stability/assembly factor-like uncharacterized protein